MGDLYCKLFINSPLPIEALFDLLSAHLKGVKSGRWAIRNELLELDLRRNGEYEPASRDFLFWPYYADLEPQTADDTQYIASICGLMAFLRRTGADTVAACDFEEELTDP